MKNNILRIFCYLTYLILLAEYNTDIYDSLSFNPADDLKEKSLNIIKSATEIFPSFQFQANR